MGYFDEQQHVDEYIQMAEGFDGRELIDLLKNHLAPGATVLELGMGPGKDLDILLEGFSATGSDASSVFLELYARQNPHADLLKLDAVTLETERTFDCIYSNKVLHHLRKSDLRQSFSRQREILTEGGLAFHSFWLGDKEEMMKGLRFVYYYEQELLELIGPGFERLEMARYTELEENDSFYVLLRNQGKG